MKYWFIGLLFVCAACPTSTPVTDDEATENESTPCASDSDCGVWEVCTQGVCAEGTVDGTSTGTADGTSTGTTDGASTGNTTGAADGDSETPDGGMADGSSDGAGTGNVESADAGLSDGAGDGSADGSNSGDVNLALTATAEASEEWSTTWSADKAIDGDMLTYWSTADGLVSATFTVTLSEAKNINKVILNSGDYPIKSFELLVSNDGSQYFSIGQYDTAANEEKTITFTAQNASHVRLDNITADPGPAWTVAAIYELEIYEAQ